MLTQIYYALAILAYAIFLGQFIISMMGGTDLDMDIDVDGDGFGDLSWGDIFSFKGVIHFLMGFAGWLSLTAYNSHIAWYDYIIAIILGIIFVVILFYVGILLYKLRYEPTGQEMEDFVGRKGIVTVVCNSNADNSYYISIQDFGGQEVKVYSHDLYEYKLGDEVVINSIENEKFYI